MKHYLLLAGLSTRRGVQVLIWILTIGSSLAQGDQKNLEKYWTFRNTFREDFVKIADEPGGSIVARCLQPLDCADTYGPDIDGTDVGKTGYGSIHWGDGMIRHGYYLSLLATEYRLLKDAGQDVTAVKNELYYALAAINRLDSRAEIEQAEAYGFIQAGKPLNGYFMREDIPEKFATNNWATSRIHAQCDDSPHYSNDNSGQLNQGVDYKTTGNSYMNSPSADQISSLMVGFRLIHDLVDNDLVNPTGDPNKGFHLVDETAAIVDRIMTYLVEHNWMMIDVNGWPVNNGGGDCVPSAYPLFTIAKKITGHDYTAEWKRYSASFYIQDVQYCITGFGIHDNVPENRATACSNISQVNGEKQAQEDLVFGATPGDLNNQDRSVFQSWLETGNLSGSYDRMAEMWIDQTTILNFLDHHTLDFLSYPLNQIKFHLGEDGTDDKNELIIAVNYGVAAGFWKNTILSAFTQTTGNTEMELVNSVLRKELPPQSQEAYRAFMDDMPLTGPFNFARVDNKGTPDDKTDDVTLQQGAPNHWASEHRWTYTSVAGGASDHVGLFNGLDYMLFHNLYRLAFKNNVPAFTQDIEEECFCEPVPVSSTAGLSDDPSTLALMEDYVDSRLKYVHSCRENIFDPVVNNVTGSFDIAPFFPYYLNLGIVTTEFETQNATVQSTGKVSVKTRFVVCNASTLTVKAGGNMVIEQKKTLVNANGTIDHSGTIRVKSGTQLVVKKDGRLVLRPGSTLVIEDKAEVIIEDGGTLDYYAGAVIKTEGDGSYLELKGTLAVHKDATFTIDYSTGSLSGLVVFAGKPVITAETGAKFLFKSKGTFDPIVLIEPLTTVNFGDADIASIRFENCAVVMNGAILELEQPVTTAAAKFVGGTIEVTDLNRFLQTDFINSGIYADMGVESKDRLNLFTCNFTADNTASNLPGVSVHGMGYQLSECHFKIPAALVVSSYGMTLNSEITNSTFENPSPNANEIAVYDESNTQVRIAGSTFTSMYITILKKGGTLPLRCNTFTNTYQDNVIATDGCLVNLSGAANAGYNEFGALRSKVLPVSQIILKNADINLTSGFNYLHDVDAVGGLVQGSLITPCASSCTINFDGNQWRDAPLQLLGPVKTSRFDLVSAVRTKITPQTLICQAKPKSCGQYDVVTSVIGFALSILPGSGNGPIPGLIQNVPKYFSQLTGRDLRLDDGIQQAMNVMTTLNNGVGNDVLAVEYFNEMFTSTINRTSAATQKLLSLAIDQMKTALAGAVNGGQVTRAQNALDFERHVAMYTHALNTMTAPITTENYKVQFYNELNKAQVLRMIGQPKKSLQILKHAESCKLDAAEQAVVNREKKYALYDIQVGNLGALALDTVIVIDSTGFTIPAPFSGPYHFGAQINNLNDILYPGCGSQGILAGDPENEVMLHAISVYPNPAMREVNIDLAHDQMDGTSVLTFFQSDGRMVQTMEVKSTENRILKLDISQWTPGTYQYKYTRPDGVITVGKLVVQ